MTQLPAFGIIQPAHSPEHLSQIFDAFQCVEMIMFGIWEGAQALGFLVHLRLCVIEHGTRRLLLWFKVDLVSESAVPYMKPHAVG